ncbi:MAG: flagellar assembly protein FliW [bacterium]|nr:flagellar assembly protein FliW [bacterium]
MRFTTRRFGELDVPNDKLIKMARPLLGFEKLETFCMIESEEMAPFLWLQSTEDPEVAFIIVNPRLFYPDYKIEVNRAEVAELRINDVHQVETYVIVTIPTESTRISVNLQGPVLVNTENNLGRQLVMVNSDYGIKHFILDEVPDAIETDRVKAAREEELIPV